MDSVRAILVYLVCLKFVHNSNETHGPSLITKFTLISTFMDDNSDGLRFNRAAKRKCTLLHVPIDNKNHQLCIWDEKFLYHDITSNTTKIYLLNGSSEPEELLLRDVDIHLAYGYVVSYPHNSLIRGYIQNGRFFGAVHIGSETYYIEPIYKFPSAMRKTDVSNRNTGVLYSTKDVHIDSDGFDNTLLNMSPAFVLQYTSDFHYEERMRTTTTRLCSVSVTADYSLFNELHNKSIEDTVMHVLLIISEVNLLIRNARIKDTKHSINVGIKIERMIIESTSNGFLSRKFSRSDEFLKHFSRGYHFGGCLSILFTYRNFGDGSLGASWTGSPDIKRIGGICEKSLFWSFPDDPTSISTLNTLVVCLKTSYGDSTPFLMSVLNTAHEIGHSFGNLHDESTNASQSYIMSPFSLSGGYAKNLMYSGESLKKMSKMIRIKGFCLEESNDNYCGNGLAEEGEECDCGIPSECLTRDPCCLPRGSGHQSCRVRRLAGYKCHPSQGLCCLPNCQYRDLSKFQLDCKNEENTCPCKNNDKNCSCGLLGRCVEEKCHNLECTRLGLKECLCPPKTDKYCITCCMNLRQKCVPAFILTDELLKTRNVSMAMISNFEKNDHFSHSSVFVKQHCMEEQCLNITFRKWKRKDVCVAFGKLGLCSIDGECVHYPRPEITPDSSGKPRTYEYFYLSAIFVILFNLLKYILF